MNLAFSAIAYRAIRDRIRAQDPLIDETTLADTVEGLTDLHDIIAAIIRSAISDEALAAGLKVRIEDMQARLERLQDRAAKRRQTAKDTMAQFEIKRLIAPDFTVSLHAGAPSLIVNDAAAIPTKYWQSGKPRLAREELKSELMDGAEIPGVTLSDAKPVLSVRTQ